MSNTSKEGEPLVRAGKRTSTNSNSNTNTHTTTNSDVLTSELLRGTSQYQNSAKYAGYQKEQGDFLSHVMSSADYAPIKKDNVHPLAQEDRTHETVVISRGSPNQFVSLPETSKAQILERLGVESDLSVSLDPSLHYYGISNYTGTLDTINLLQGRGNISEATYPSHLPRRVPAVQAIQQLNQVPQRFSQFIADQSHTLGAHVASRTHSISRNISLLMGSQTTIFSSRSDHRIPDGLRRRRNHPTKCFTGGAGFDSGFDAGSPSFALERRKAIRFKEGGRLYRLRLALRKMAAKIRRKLGAMCRFVLGPKKATSRAQLASHRPFLSRPKSTKRKPKGIAQILAPLANPEPGNGEGALKTEGLLHELRGRAGFGGVPDLVANDKDGDASPLSNYLSEQRNLNRHHRLGSQIALLGSSSIAPPPPPHMCILPPQPPPKSHTKLGNIESPENLGPENLDPEKKRLQVAWKQYLLSVLSLRIKLRQEVTLFQLLLTNQPIHTSLQSAKKHQTELSIGDKLSTSSRRWLDSVAEIKRHRASFVPTKYSSAESEAAYSFLHHTAGSFLAPTALSDTHLRFTSPGVFKSAADSLSLIESDDRNGEVDEDTENESLDECIEKLQEVLNRRSILGEMLDFDSEELESLSSSTFSRDSFVVSLHDSTGSSSPLEHTHSVADSQLLKGYGTLKRLLTIRSSSQGSSNTSISCLENAMADT